VYFCSNNWYTYQFHDFDDHRAHACYVDHREFATVTILCLYINNIIVVRSVFVVLQIAHAYTKYLGILPLTAVCCHCSRLRDALNAVDESFTPLHVRALSLWRCVWRPTHTYRRWFRVNALYYVHIAYIGWAGHTYSYIIIMIYNIISICIVGTQNTLWCRYCRY